MKNSAEVMIRPLFECRQFIPKLARLWFEEILKGLLPGASLRLANIKLKELANDNVLPYCLVAIYNKQPVGMIALRHRDRILSHLGPWVGSLVVHRDFRQQQIASYLMKTMVNHTKEMGFDKIYSASFQSSILEWHERLGWERVTTTQLFDRTTTVMSLQLNLGEQP